MRQLLVREYNAPLAPSSYVLCIPIRVGEGQAEREREREKGSNILYPVLAEPHTGGKYTGVAVGRKRDREKKCAARLSGRAQGPKSENRVGQWHPRKGIRATGRTAGRSDGISGGLWIRESGPP